MLLHTHVSKMHVHIHTFDYNLPPSVSKAAARVRMRMWKRCWAVDSCNRYRPLKQIFKKMMSPYSWHYITQLLLLLWNKIVMLFEYLGKQGKIPSFSIMVFTCSTMSFLLFLRFNSVLCPFKKPELSHWGTIYCQSCGVHIQIDSTSVLICSRHYQAICLL